MKQITFKKLSIQNFLSVGKELWIDFKDGITIITGENRDKNNDRNGVGKSTIISAFYFALFGSTIRDIKKDEVVNNLAKKNAVVKLEFTMDENGTQTEYRIERGIAPSFCRLYVNNTENKTLSTIPATNNYILNLINTSASLFRNTVTMSLNNNIPFMRQRKNEKRDFVEGIFKLEIIKVINKIAKENYDVVARDYNTLNQKYEENKTNIDTYESKKNLFENNRAEKIEGLLKRQTEHTQSIADFKSRLVKVDEASYNNDVQKIQSLKTSLSQCQQNISTERNKSIQINAKILSYQQRNQILARDIQALQEKLKTFPKFEDGPITTNETISSLKTSIDKSKERITTNQYDIRGLEKRIEQIKSIGSVCDKCLRPFDVSDTTKNKNDIEDATKTIERLKTEIDESKEIIITNNKKIERLETTERQKTEKREITEKSTASLHELNGNETLQALAKEELVSIQSIIEKLETDLKTQEANLETLNAKIVTTKMAVESNKTISEMIVTTTRQLQNIESDIHRTKNEVNEFDELIQKVTQKNKEIEAELVKQREQIDIYNIIKQIMSDDGFKSHIIKKMLTVLNERINYYLQKLDANCTMVFNEYFDDSLINDRGVECSYDGFSGGEQRRIDLACLFAFMDIRRIQGEVAFNINFFDEILDSALSTDGSQKLFEILHERSTDYKEHSYIITHKQENLKNPLVNDIIYLEKIGGITRIKEKI